jgi:hypothetical protein
MKARQYLIKNNPAGHSGISGISAIQKWVGMVVF